MSIMFLFLFSSHWLMTVSCDGLQATPYLFLLKKLHNNHSKCKIQAMDQYWSPECRNLQLPCVNHPQNARSVWSICLVGEYLSIISADCTTLGGIYSNNLKLFEKDHDVTRNFRNCYFLKSSLGWCVHDRLSATHFFLFAYIPPAGHP